MINNFSNFKIEYSEEVTEDNYFKKNIVFHGEEGYVTLLSYFFYLDMAKQLTSKNEKEVLEGLKAYKWAVQEHLNRIEI